jgi:hypothetical protein
MEPTPFPDWTPAEVVQQLQSLGLHAYSQSFLDNHINGEAFMFLTDNHLKELGVKLVGHRLTIANFISEWRPSKPRGPLPPIAQESSGSSEEDDPPPRRPMAPLPKSKRPADSADLDFGDNPFQSRPKIGGSFAPSGESIARNDQSSLPPPMHDSQPPKRGGPKNPPKRSLVIADFEDDPDPPTVRKWMDDDTEPGHGGRPPVRKQRSKDDTELRCVTTVSR